MTASSATWGSAPGMSFCGDSECPQPQYRRMNTVNFGGISLDVSKVQELIELISKSN
jgi:hypothetical protein